MKNNNHCRLCKAELNSTPSFVLKNLPLGVQYFPDKNELSKDHPVELDIYRCESCAFVQAFGNQVVYESENSAATSISPSMMDHKYQQAENFLNKYSLKGKKVFEAGCGDGHFLKMLKDAGAQLAVGVEPSVKSKESSNYKNDVTIYSDYITHDKVIPEGPFDAFATFHVMEHLPDIHDFISGISNNLKEGGIGFVEVPSSEMVEDELRFYDIINDHLNYFTLRTMRLAFEMHNFEILDTYRDWNGEHNVTIVRKLKKYDYQAIKDAKNNTIKNLESALNEFDEGGIAIWGASMHSLTLLSQFTTDKIKYVIDSAVYKQGKYTPVTHFPIVSPKELETNPVKCIIIIAPRFVDEIVDDLKNKIKFQGTIAILDKEEIVFK
ncbi:MAG: class I SAM-dependent methyltransferase [Bacteroidota bacterium]